MFHRQFPDMNLTQGDGQHLEHLEEVCRIGNQLSIEELHVPGESSSTRGPGVEVTRHYPTHYKVLEVQTVMGCTW